MKINAILGAAALAGALAVTLASSPANAAASLMTDAFMTNAHPNVDFLDRSSRLVLDSSRNARLKAFALDQARDQTRTANDLDDWIKADLGPAAGPDGLASGRSVAVGKSASPAAQEMAAMSPASQEDIDNMCGLTGKDLDAFYKTKQMETLTQLKTLYTAYATEGDDTTLQAIAKRELPKINRQIAELRRL